MNEKMRNYLVKTPYKIELDQLNDKQKNLLMESPVFCMLPWVHLHAFPDGRVYPCCTSDFRKHVGNIRKKPLTEIWNDPPMKKLRQNMLNESTSPECAKCYEQEKFDIISNRENANRNFGHLINIVDNTTADGEFADFKMRYFDIRFSNLCNFRCRTCGPGFSSNWYNDHIKIFNSPPISFGEKMSSVEYAAGSEEETIKQIEPHLPYVERIYFAGGEPLIMKEHYYILERLLELGKTNIQILYNTNFSELSYKNKHVFDYWKKFKHVSVGASIDGSYKRAELIRKGTDWNQIVENRKLLQKELPHVKFFVNFTLSAMNVLHMFDFHKEWCDLGLIEPYQFNVNPVSFPLHYRPDIFPKDFVTNYIEPVYNKHLEWLKQADNSYQRAVNGVEGALAYIKASEKQSEWNNFIAQIDLMDRVRGEDFWQIFPELLTLKYYRV